MGLPRNQSMCQILAGMALALRMGLSPLGEVKVISGRSCLIPAFLLLWLGSTALLLGQTSEERKQFEAVQTKARKGDAEAQLALGSRYADGEGVARDLTLAVKWHRKAAEQGLARAQLLLALEYADGLGLKTDRVKAAEWLRKAGAQGLPEAEIALGNCYANGDGVRENAVEAVKWYRQAADQHLPEAEDALGECYLNGAGAPKDTASGVKWIWKAAEQGFAPAQNRLGLCYLTGEGVTKNYLTAYQWFSLGAAAGGDGAADIKLNLLRTEPLLTADQIVEAQRLTREFKPHKVADGSPPGAEVAGAIAPDHPPVESASGNTTDTGFLNVRAEDDTCEVYVDGSFVGNTPARLKLPEGTHVTLVKKPGFKDYRREIKITGGAELNLRAVLERR